MKLSSLLLVTTVSTFTFLSQANACWTSQSKYTATQADGSPISFEFQQTQDCTKLTMITRVSTDPTGVKKTYVLDGKHYPDDKNPKFIYDAQADDTTFTLHSTNDGIEVTKTFKKHDDNTVTSTTVINRNGHEITPPDLDLKPQHSSLASPPDDAAPASPIH